MQFIEEELYTSISLYNIYKKCDSGILSTCQKSNKTNPSRMLFDWFSSSRKPSRLSGSNSVSVGRDEEECVKTETVCDDESLYTEWLNMPEVRAALHVDPYIPKNWTECSGEVFENYTHQYDNMSSHYKELLNIGVS
ncbi:hypothetical protein EG68_12241 [Paragonimus skrjabini miyazakii]|uniref:Uncharacterized protein n=1 Tax=Paragonimus skrjabini miyazakii TaxID=59628 RepID=A0A8S9Y837_9TREM|nr:hypothetical protein EG68_12241 [Paragonimus skrjabini miyazakii]